jgi:hypothetical protein
MKPRVPARQFEEIIRKVKKFDECEPKKYTIMLKKGGNKSTVSTNQVQDMRSSTEYDLS